MKIFVWTLAVAVIALVGLLALGQSSFTITKSAPGPYDQFAQCLKDKGALFYGASWCSHCQAQKENFGNSAHLLPYVECSTPDGQSQTPECAAKGIQSYPTWIFADGTQSVGEQTMSELAEKTGCTLPAIPSAQ